VVGEVDEAGHLGLSYSKLTAVLVGATQEQQRTIDAQEQTILQLRHEHTAVTEQLTAVTEQLEAERRTNAEQGRELQELRSLVEGLLRAQAGAGRR
jgi:transposase